MSFLPGQSMLLNGQLQFVKELASATSSAATVTVPSTVRNGDLLVLLDRAVGLTAVTTVVPSGFTSIVNSSGTSGATFIRQIASYKIADGTEASTSITGMDDVTEYKALYAFRGNNYVMSVNASTPNAEVTDADPSAQSVTASAGTVPLIVFGCYATTAGAVDPRTFSTTKDGEISPDNVMYLAYKIHSSAPANATIDMDDEGGLNTLQSFYLELS